ncbi:MAG: 16S rRNA (cytosine(967)-C(5))-methyltransferase RsmB [Clostridia bacterium]|nr:16S rRNA (cytosine(967)-C(5))-methyltransferase RsmB [Clostridia bacterium]
MKSATELSPRALALTTLLRIDADNAYANLSLDAALRNSTLAPADKRLFTTLVYGVIERKITLDYCISKLSERPIASLDPKALTCLRLGLYQLLFLDRIPPHAAVNESVALAGRRAGGFVNACLREYLRRKESFPFPKKEDGLLPYLSVTYSVPTALCEKFLSEFGESDTESILSAFSVHPPVTIALNPTVGARENYLALLHHAGIEGTPTEHAPHGVTIPSGSAIDALPGFADGYFYVQDEASQICVEALGALPGETVIDACACPGSKSFGSALRMRNEGSVRSCDLHESKLSLVRSGAKRLGITILTAEVRDGKVFDPALEATADRVLCDVPCSGYGVMGKKPDIRYKDPATAERLPEIQYAILENCARYLKPGGTLVYSTCTVFSDENWYNVQKFLAAHPDFAPEDFTVGTLQSENGMLTLRPDLHRTDGFFIAKMHRNA